MEKFPSFKANKVESVEKKSIWKRIGKISQSIALSALLSIPAVSNVFAQSRQKPESQKTNIESLAQKTGKYEKSIIVYLKDKGMPGRLNNSIDLKKWRSSIDKENFVESGYDDKGKPIFIRVVKSTPEGAILYLDKNVDGLIDRVIVNNIKIKSQQHAAFGLNSFESMDKIAAEADILAGMKSEDVKVYSFDRLEKKSVAVDSVDFNSGIADKLEGEDAKKLADGMQKDFADYLDQIIQEINKGK